MISNQLSAEFSSGLSSEDHIAPSGESIPRSSGQVKIIASGAENIENVLADCLRALREGLLVVAPTETRYALLARADDKAAISRLYDLKGRSAKAAVSIFVAEREALWLYGQRTRPALSLAQRFLPGPLTLVVTATELAANTLDSRLISEGRVGLRFSSDNIISQLVRLAKFPLSATSANLSGASDCETVSEIKEGLGGGVAIYLDDGPRNQSVSTVVAVSESEVKILRAGSILENDIQATLSERNSGSQPQ